jgi:hypothetical protein
MLLKIIEREHINTTKWNALVTAKLGHSIFSHSYYLDEVAENWCIITDNEYSCGIAIPYTIRLGVKCFTTPIFVRYLEWFGSQRNWEIAANLIENSFSGGSFQVPENLANYQPERYFQIVEGDRKLGSQAKRMLAKAKDYKVEIANESDNLSILKIIESELPSRISTLNTRNIAILRQLVLNLGQKNFVKSFVIKSESKIVAGIILIEFNGVLLYLKGASSSDFKKNGAMYALMDCAIVYAQQNNLIFDFGGSSAEGVRRFNLNLGGVDIQYGVYHSEKAPFWFKGLKRIKNLWIKK